MERLRKNLIDRSPQSVLSQLRYTKEDTIKSIRQFAHWNNICSAILLLSALLKGVTWFLSNSDASSGLQIWWAIYCFFMLLSAFLGLRASDKKSRESAKSHYYGLIILGFIIFINQILNFLIDENLDGVQWLFTGSDENSQWFTIGTVALAVLGMGLCLFVSFKYKGYCNDLFNLKRMKKHEMNQQLKQNNNLTRSNSTLPLQEPKEDQQPYRNSMPQQYYQEQIPVQYSYQNNAYQPTISPICPNPQYVYPPQWSNYQPRYY